MESRRTVDSLYKKLIITAYSIWLSKFAHLAASEVPKENLGYHQIVRARWLSAQANCTNTSVRDIVLPENIPEEQEESESGDGNDVGDKSESGDENGVGDKSESGDENGVGDKSESGDENDVGDKSDESTDEEEGENSEKSNSDEDEDSEEDALVRKAAYKQILRERKKR